MNTKKSIYKLALALWLMSGAALYSTLVQASDNKSPATPSTLNQAPAYICPMHPEETSHEPGRCAICNMFLVENEPTPELTSSSLAKQNKPNSQAYICPMHPEETSHEPGRCAICNMFLVKNEPTPELASSLTEQNKPNSQAYICPMHPEETSHEPGRCAICNMFLVENEAISNNGNTSDTASEPHTDPHKGHLHATENTVATSQVDKVFNSIKPSLNTEVKSETKTSYICPMHAHIVSDEPGTCPICGMNLEAIETGGNPTELSIQVSGSMQQALAIRVSKAEQDTLWQFIKTVGQIDYDQSQIEHVHARVEGWIEKLTVTSVGDKVTKGQLLYEIYSPDLINAQDDYLLAQDSFIRSGKSKNYQDLVRKAQLRLELLGMTKAQISKLGKTKKTQYRVPFYAKQSGIIKALSVRDGMYIQPQTEIMSMVDLSRVWVIADVFENEQAWLKVGQAAEVSVPAMGLKEIEGEIDYIYPELDPVTRSLRVRIVLNNPETQLRPNTLAKVSLFGGPKRNRLVIPQEALIQTGKANRVIVKQDDTSFTVREVTLGIFSQGRVEILSGLKQGEQVVTSGQFLLDSEASLKGSILRLSSSHQH